MHSLRATTLLVMELVCLLAIVTIATTGPVSKKSIRDSGQAINCGSVPFNVTWTPRILTAGQPVSLYVEYTFPHAFDGGSFNITVYSGEELFLQHVLPVTCHDVEPFFPCPIPAGTTGSQTFNLNQTIFFKAIPGTYLTILDIKNKAMQEMACAEFNITIQNNSTSP